jgi:hypothetical protein
MPDGNWTPLDKCHWAPFVNATSEKIPPYAVLRITGTQTVKGRAYFRAGKPNSTVQDWYALNGAAAVAAGGIGECTFSPQAIAQYSGSSVSAGDNIGPAANSWTLTNSGTTADSFVYLGDRSSNRGLNLVEVVQISGSAAAQDTSADYAFAGRNGQTVTSGSTAEVQFDQTGAYGDTSISGNHFVLETAGLWEHMVRFDVQPEAGPNSTWQIITTCDVKSVFSSVATGSSEDIAFVDLDGNDSASPARCVASWTGWISNPTAEVWAEVGAGDGGDLTLSRMKSSIKLLGTAT